jgi:hypothetical protein
MSNLQSEITVRKSEEKRDLENLGTQRRIINIKIDIQETGCKSVSEFM